MSYEKKKQVSPLPNLIRFYYLLSTISSRVEKITSYKASATVKPDGQGDYDRIQLSVDEKELLKDYMRKAMLDFFDLLFHIISGDSVVHDTGVVLTGASRVTSGSFVVGQGYTIAGLGSATVASVAGTLSGYTMTGIASTAGLKVGMTVAKNSGTGAFTGTPAIVSIDSETQVTFDVTAATPGAIVATFSGGAVTNFTLIGASANTIGVSFIATGAGAGNGTADISDFGSYCDILDNAKYRTINLDLIDKTIEDGIVDYILAKWYILKNSPTDAQVHLAEYQKGLAEVSKRSISLRQY